MQFSSYFVFFGNCVCVRRLSTYDQLLLQLAAHKQSDLPLSVFADFVFVFVFSGWIEIPFLCCVCSHRSHRFLFPFTFTTNRQRRIVNSCTSVIARRSTKLADWAMISEVCHAYAALNQIIETHSKRNCSLQWWPGNKHSGRAVACWLRSRIFCTPSSS